MGVFFVLDLSVVFPLGCSLSWQNKRRTSSDEANRRFPLLEGERSRRFMLLGC
jgi:hypothetical protein